ncbi:MAG: hypothetical protein ACOY71_03290 [Gemmatimonadota bacterium]
MTGAHDSPFTEDLLARTEGFLTPEEAALRIRLALERRSGRPWVVAVKPEGRGWLHITVPMDRVVRERPDVPIRLHLPGQPFLSVADERELTQLLGLWPEYPYGVPIPPSNEFYWEFIDRAETGGSTRPAAWPVD